MKFSPPQEYSTTEPDRLGLELTLLTDESSKAFRDVELERAARLRPRRIRGAASVVSFPCLLDELLVINSEDADVRVKLPQLGPLSAGRVVAYARTNAANAVVFEGSNGALINGAATFTTATSVGRGLDLINDGVDWWTA